MSAADLALAAYSRGSTPRILSTPVDVSATTTTTLIAAPGEGKRIIVMSAGLHASSAGTGTIMFDSDTAALTGTMIIAAQQSVCIPVLILPVNKPLRVTTSGASLDGAICYGIV